MKRFRVGLSYDGTDFCGWGVQPGKRTVQKTLEEACQQVYGNVGEVTAAGRTDKGVHAVGQTVHLDLPDNTIAQDAGYRLNAVLPEDVAIINISEVDSDFHARYHCVAKIYAYRLVNGDVRPVLSRRTHHYEPRLLNFAAIQEAAGIFKGTHDFQAFTNSGHSSQTTVRTILEVDVQKTDGVITFLVKGNGFLYNQLRIMVGTLVEVGLGKLKPKQISDLIDSKDRQKAGPTINPKGLTLEKTLY